MTGGFSEEGVTARGITTVAPFRGKSHLLAERPP
jgi:hypothetical protein